jgi:hypothetical protein
MKNEKKETPQYKTYFEHLKHRKSLFCLKNWCSGCQKVFYTEGSLFYKKWAIIKCDNSPIFSNFILFVR